MTVYVNPVLLLPLVFIIINHVFQANSASFEPHPGNVFFGKGRILRKLPTPPPAPKLGQNPHVKLIGPPPPPPSSSLQTSRNLRTVRKGSPSAPKLSRPRSFRTFLPGPPSPAPPKAPGYTHPSKSPTAPPPPKGGNI